MNAGKKAFAAIRIALTSLQTGVHSTIGFDWRLSLQGHRRVTL